MRIARWGALFCLVLFVSVAHGQNPARSAHPTTGELSGDVADMANAPIGKAFVLVHQPAGKKDFIVKVSNGRFELPLPPGRYDVFVSAEGFAPTCKGIRISAGETASYKPRLERNSD
jgi:hypothetical protein